MKKTNRTPINTTSEQTHRMYREEREVMNRIADMIGNASSSCATTIDFDTYERLGKAVQDFIVGRYAVWCELVKQNNLAAGDAKYLRARATAFFLMNATPERPAWTEDRANWIKKHNHGC